jgi:hypothetical protein
MVPNCVLEYSHLCGTLDRVARQKALRHAVVPLVRELDASATQNALEVSMRNVKKNAGAVTGTGVTARGPAMGKAPEDLDAHLHDCVRGRTL